MLRALRLFFGGLFAAALFLLPSAAGTRTAFRPGRAYTFYCGSASSQAEIVTCKSSDAARYKYFLGGAVAGESTVYAAGEATAAEILASFEAELLFSEEAAGTTSYYAYTPSLGAPVEIGGYAVNLHVAVRAGGETAAGTPLIFGGF